MKKKLLSFLSLTAIAIFAFAATQSLRRAATTIWENADGVVVNWNGDVTVAKDKFANLKIGDIITVTVKDVAAGATKANWEAQVSLRDAWWNTLEQDVPIAESDTKAEFTVTGDIQAILQERGLMISGKGFSATKIEISDGTYTGSKNSIWIGNTTAKPSVSNFHFKMANGGYNDNDVWKNGVKAGDIIRIAATAIADFSGDKYCLLSYSGADTEYAWKDYQGMPAVATETGFDVVVTEGNVAQLMIDGIIVNQAGYTITQVELIPMYAVNVATGIENGTVEVDKATAAEGEEVTITATPNDGYKLASTSVRGVTTDLLVTVTNNKFKMPADAVTVSATFAQPEDITIKAEDITGGDITAAITAATTGKIAKNITINLAADGAYTISKSIEANQGVIINGNGSKIDASALADPFIKMNPTPIFAAVESGQYVIKDPIMIDKVTISGLDNSLISDGGAAYAFDNFTINESVIEALQTKAFTFDFSKSMPINFTITNSTIYSKVATSSKNFMSISGQQPVKITGYEGGAFNFLNNTFVNCATTKQFINTNTIKGKGNVKYTWKNNIFLDCGNKQIWDKLDNGNAPKDCSMNTYWHSGANAGEKFDTNVLTTDPGITAENIAAGTFTIGASTAQAKFKTGDPRWQVEYVAPATAGVEDITLDAEAGDLNKQLTAKVYEVLNKLNTVGNITINLAENGAYTISSSIEANQGVVINGNGAKIDASKLAVPFIKMNSTPIVSAVESGQFVIKDPIKIDKVTISGLDNSLISDGGAAYAFDNFTISESVIEALQTKAFTFDFSKSMPINFNIKNSTIYSKVATSSKNFMSISGQQPVKITGYEGGAFNFLNNTFVNCATTKQFINTNTIKGKGNVKYTWKNNIFLDCGNKLIWDKLDNGNAPKDCSMNTYWYSGANAGEKYDTNVLTTDPGITAENIAAGTFTIGASTAQAKEKTGDPRWLVAFTGYTITMGTVTNGTVEAGGTSPYFAGEKVRLTLTPAEGYAIDNKPTFKNDEDVDVTELVTVGQDADGFYLVMPAFNITASYAFSKLYTITLPTETTHGTITIVKPEGTNKSVAGKLIKIKVTGLSDGYKVVAKNGDTDITLNEGDHATYDYYFEMPEGDVTISIVDATGINAISVDGAADIFADGKPVYNLAGQRVFKGYKGLVIKNGKKVVVK